MEPNGLDPVYNAELVIRALEDIDHQNDEQLDSLVTELLCVVWGGPPAVNQ
jgi:hypothetical protein